MMESECKIDFDVNTTINGDDIESQIDLIMENAIVQTMHEVVRTRDKQVRDALLKMGWTPPTKIILPR